MMRDNAGSFLASTPSHRKRPRVHFIAKLLTSSWEDYSFFSVHHGVCWRFDASIRRGQATRKCKYGKVYWFDMVGGDFQLSYISYRFKDVEISWYVWIMTIYIAFSISPQADKSAEESNFGVKQGELWIGEGSSNVWSTYWLTNKLQEGHRGRLNFCW